MENEIISIIESENFNGCICNYKYFKIHGYGTYVHTVLMEKPNHMLVKNIDKSKMTIDRFVTVDICLAKEVMFLWSKGISTTGCCCGHGIDEKGGYIGVEDIDINKMKSLGYKVYPNGDREDSFYSKTTGNEDHNRLMQLEQENGFLKTYINRLKLSVNQMYEEIK